MKLTQFTFYQNTPFTDFMNTIDFGTDEARDNYFNSHFVQLITAFNYNFIRDRLILKISNNTASWDFLNKVNYCRFTSQFDGQTYYCQVVQCEYLNDNTTQVHLIIDGLMTFCQGGIAQYAKNVQIDRQHLTKNTLNANLQYLRTNDDILKFNNLHYVKGDLYSMTDLRVVFRSSVDLSKDFGDEDSPTMQTSQGQTYDYVISPQNLYTCGYDDFSDLMGELQKYPWITQNFTSVIIAPNDIFDKSDLEDAKVSSGFKKLQKFKKNHYSANLGEIKELTHDETDLYNNVFKIPGSHPEILRNAYCNIELNNYQGSQIQLDPAFLTNGVKIFGEVIVGYDNQIAFYQNEYRSIINEDDGKNVRPGSYLNNAIIFNSFDSVPMLINNYTLGMAKGAHQRALAENNLIGGLAGNVVNPNEKLQDRFMSALALTSGGLNPTNIGGKLVDEWQFYRKQQAQFQDMKISAPTITDMSTNNSFSIKQGFFGITAKYATLSPAEIYQIVKYHEQFGFEWNRVDDLEDTNSMTYLNYVKFSGNWLINDRNVPESVMEQIRIQFENGVKIWHNPDNLENPFKQDILLKNVRKY